MISLVDRKVLVTGGHGFLGSHVVDVLEARGAKVYTPRKAGYDLTYEDDVVECFADFEPEIVIHCAARMGGIGANRARPGLFCYENLTMAANVIEQANRFRKLKLPSGASGGTVEKLVLIGTVCSYPKFAPVPFREEDLWNGYPEETNGPYGLAKKMAIVLAQAYRQEYGLNAISLLMTNMYGPRDNFDLDTSHVIPALIRKIQAAKKAGTHTIELWGTGRATRDFLYVEDAAEAVVRATECYDSPEPVNIGSGTEISMADLAFAVAEAMGYPVDLTFDTSRPDGQPRRVLDTRRAAEAFGWRATTRPADGLRNVLAAFDREWPVYGPVYSPATAAKRIRS